MRTTRLLIPVTALVLASACSSGHKAAAPPPQAGGRAELLAGLGANGGAGGGANPDLSAALSGLLGGSGGAAGLSGLGGASGLGGLAGAGAGAPAGGAAGTTADSGATGDGAGTSGSSSPSAGGAAKPIDFPGVESARAFTEGWDKEFMAAMVKLDASQVDPMSLPDCNCREILAKFISSMKMLNAHIKEVKGPKPDSHQDVKLNDGWRFEEVVDVPPVPMYDSNDRVVYTTPAKENTHASVTVRWTGSEWKIAAVGGDGVPQ